MVLGLLFWLLGSVIIKSQVARAKYFVKKISKRNLKCPLDFLKIICYTIIVPREWARPRYLKITSKVEGTEWKALELGLRFAHLADALDRVIITVSHRCSRSAQTKKFG